MLSERLRDDERLGHWIKILRIDFQFSFLWFITDVILFINLKYYIYNANTLFNTFAVNQN